VITMTKSPREVVMDTQSAGKEMRYRLIKVILVAMLEDGIISEAEFEVIRLKLVGKLTPLIVITSLELSQSSHLAN